MGLPSGSVMCQLPWVSRWTWKPSSLRRLWARQRGMPFLGTVAPWAFQPVEWSASHQWTGRLQPSQAQTVARSMTASRAEPRKSRERRPRSMTVPSAVWTTRRMWATRAVLMTSSGCRRRPVWVRLTTSRNLDGSGVAPVVVVSKVSWSMRKLTVARGAPLVGVVLAAAERAIGEQGVGAALGFAALQVAGDDFVVGAEAVAGFGPVGVPFGFGEPAEDFGEFGAVGVGEVAGEVVAAVGAGPEVEAPLVLALFVAGAVAVGVGEGFPHAGVGFEVGVGEGLGVVEQFGCVTVEQFARDARVGDDAGHQGGLGDADGADGFGFGPIGEAVMHAGGL